MNNAKAPSSNGEQAGCLETQTSQSYCSRLNRTSSHALSCNKSRPVPAGPLRTPPPPPQTGLQQYGQVSVTHDIVPPRTASICATRLRVAHAQGPSFAMPQAVWIAFKFLHWLAASRKPSKHTQTRLTCSGPHQTTTVSDQAGPCERTRPGRTLSGPFDPTQASAAPPGPLALRRKA